MAERDEMYVDSIASKRPIGTTRFHCEESPEGGWQTSRNDLRGGEHGTEDECAELQRRLRSGIGAGSNPNLR